MRAELWRRFPDQQFLIVHYGDHQPTAARTLLGLPASTTIEKVMESKNEAALTTYYAIDAVRYQPLSAPILFSPKFNGRNVDNQHKADRWG